MKVRLSRSARRHGIGRKHALFVMESAAPVVTTNDRDEGEYLWIGYDDRGVRLEIVGVVVEDDLLLILHVMPVNYRRTR